MVDPHNLEGSFGFISFRGSPDLLKPACHRITECGENALADMEAGIHAMATAFSIRCLSRALVGTN
jgi:hypothetical protein